MNDFLVLPNGDVIHNISIFGGTDGIEILNDTFRFEDYIDGCRDGDLDLSEEFLKGYHMN